MSSSNSNKDNGNDNLAMMEAELLAEEAKAAELLQKKRAVLQRAREEAARRAEAEKKAGEEQERRAWEEQEQRALAEAAQKEAELAELIRKNQEEGEWQRFFF